MDFVRFIFRLGVWIFERVFIFPILLFACWYAKRKRKTDTKPRLVWGVDPIITIKYWSTTMREAGFEAVSFVTGFYSAYKREDFDIYYYELFYKSKRSTITHAMKMLNPYLAFIYTILHFDIVHTYCTGFTLGNTRYAKYEYDLLQRAGCKIVIIPYGGDFYRYSKIIDPVLRHAIMKSYPSGGRNEDIIEERVQRAVKYADCFFPGVQLDGAGRWDVLSLSPIAIDLNEWIPKVNCSMNDGTNGVVKILHTPNHRGFKGTEFIINAVDELKQEGLKIELILLELVANEEVKRIMRDDADFLVEQIIYSGYALSGVEGMATGLPVLSNIMEEAYMRVFRLYSFMGECPIFPTRPENVKENIRLMVTNPELRVMLGKAGRQYAEKYHSYSAIQYMFLQIYDRIWYNKEVNLIDMYNPTNKDSFNNKSNLIRHPFVNNQLSGKWKEMLFK